MTLFLISRNFIILALHCHACSDSFMNETKSADVTDRVTKYVVLYREVARFINKLFRFVVFVLATSKQFQQKFKIDLETLMNC